jgi:predicted enzyme related to lactoylglutathione lyase
VLFGLAGIFGKAGEAGGTGYTRYVILLGSAPTRAARENNKNIKHKTMKKQALIILAFAGTFGLGYAFNSVVSATSKEHSSTRKVTGIGGIFFKCKDPKKMREWYKTHLGLSTNNYGCVFEWRQGMDSSQKGFTQWSPFSEKTKYFEPSAKEFMINYRVENLAGLLDELRAAGVVITDTVQSVEYGKFVHIMDIEGNKIELWEPNDVEFEKLGKKIGATTTK